MEENCFLQALVLGSLTTSLPENIMPNSAIPAKPAKSAGRSSAASHPLEGKKAPAFELTDATGKAVKLKDLTAQGTVVLYFYPKDMTPGCTTEACNFRDNLGAVRKAGAQIVGVSGDSVASHQKFASKYDLNFTLLADPENKVTKAYGVYKMKSLYGREFMGIERTTIIIDRDGVVRKVFPKVKVAQHAAEVLAALKEL
jgi:thioredoxin-dependent peroxiredoxin